MDWPGPWNRFAHERISPPMSRADAVQKISDWLIDQGLSEGGYDDLLAGFCEKLNSAGIIVQRSMMAMRTLHPTMDARGFV